MLSSIFSKSIFKGVFQVLVLRVLGVVLFFSLTLFLTNYFLPELVGKYDFVKSLLLIVGGICLLGTNQIMIYYSGVLTSHNSLGSIKKIYLKVTLVIFIACLFSYLIFSLIPEQFIISFFNKPEAYVLTKKLIFFLFPFCMMLLNFDTIRALQKTKVSEFYRNIIRYLPFFILAIYILKTTKQELLVETFLVSFILVALVTTIHVFYLFKQTQKTSTGPNKTFKIKTILKRSMPMAMSAVSFFLMQSIDIVLLSKYDSFDNVAFYAVAIKIAAVATLVLVSVTVFIAPKVANFWESKNIEELTKLIKTSTKLSVFLGVPGILILMIFPTFFLQFFGSAYEAAKTALLILLAGQLIISFCGPTAIYLNMTGRQNYLNKIMIFAVVINIILNVLLIPKYGMIGAAIATVFSQLLWNLLAIIYSYKNDNIILFFKL
ncbi:polysaccharide biosynthesis protein [unidentified eubacterium SCB49]|nr:polysaccharide biosynthesis protein [unidentified eubacterium SCB49]